MLRRSLPSRLPAALIVLLFASLPRLFCQGFHVGVKGGIPLTQYFETGADGARNFSARYSAATRRYTVGVVGEWGFTNSLGLEINPMYHRVGYVAVVRYFDTAGGGFRNSAVDVKGGSWDFPLLARYRLGPGRRPFIGGGAVLRYVGPVRGRGEQTDGSAVTRISSTRPVDTREPSELRKRLYPGVAAGAGLETRVGRVRVIPEFRYTRWTANISAPGGLLRFASNQAEFLVGILF
jgi:hypothetical protein